MNCPRCGEYIDDTDLFCGCCGYKIEKTQSHKGLEPGLVKSPSSKKGKIFFVLIPILSLLLLFIIFSGLLIADVITAENIPVISKYEEFLDNLIGKHPDTTYQTESSEENSELSTQPNVIGETMTIYEPNFEKNKKITTTMPQLTESFTDDDYSEEYGDSIPPELSEWANGLVEENRTYEVTLTYSNSNINFRSSPKVTNKGDSDYNFICNIPDGQLVNVAYIYNGTWAVFKYNDKWGFSSIYSGNDPSNNRIMTPVD